MSATAARRVIVDGLFPQIMVENVEVVKMSSRSATRNVCAQLVNEPVPRILNEIVEQANSSLCLTRTCVSVSSLDSDHGTTIPTTSSLKLID